MKLIIAEKPDMMRKIAKAIDGANIKTTIGKMISKTIIYSHAVGHVTRLSMPEQIDEKYSTWNFDTLPFHFDNIPLRVDEKTKTQFNILKELLNSNEVTEIINACDADREGELIFRNILLKAGSKCKNITRMWITSTTDEGIKEAFEKRKNSKEYDSMAISAKARSYADYLIGLNATVAMTTKFGGYKNVLSVGRVQTPTLRIICDLENEIINFASNKYYKLTAEALNHDMITIEGNYENSDLENNAFKKKKDVEDLIKELGTGEAKVVLVKNTERKMKPQLLYSLSDLQIEMNKRYGMSANEVLAHCQALYEEYSLTTYPRTDENHISKEMASKVKTIIRNLPIYKEFTQEILDNDWNINSSVIADKESVGAHEAITPVVGKPSIETINKLKPDERKVYDAIVQRFISTFYPNAIYSVQKITFERKKEKFTYNSEQLKEEGFLKVYGKEVTFDNTILPLTEGEKIDIVGFKINECETNPPSRFTEGSLIKMMKDPSKYTSGKDEKDILKKAEGIGTEATRASIIEQLKKREYIVVKGKTIHPTTKGMEFIKIIPSELIKSVSLTAQFESKLEKIKNKEYDYQDFMDEIKEMNEQFIKELSSIINSKEVSKNMNLDKLEKITTCPHCGEKIVEDNYSYKCVKCEVKIYKNTLEKTFNYKKISKTTAVQLLTKGISKKKVKLFSKSKNKEFEAYLTYEFKEGQQYPNNVWIAFDK